MTNLTPTEFYRQQAYRLAYAEHWLYCKLFSWYRGECLAVCPAGTMKKPPALDPAMKDIVARARREWVEQTGLPAFNPHDPETWQTAAIAAVMDGRPGVDVYTQTPKGLAKIITPWAVAKMAKTQPSNHKSELAPLDGVKEDLVNAVREIGPNEKRTQTAIMAHLAVNNLDCSLGYAKTCLAELVRSGHLLKGPTGYEPPEWRSGEPD